MTEALRRQYAALAGPMGWDDRQRAIAAVWESIRAAIDRLNLDPHRVRLYQDGLPVSGHEEQIVRTLAQTGSPNHIILLDWMDRGATLTGTESPDLLREEYLVARQLLGADAPKQAPVDRPALLARSRDILSRRDAYIANRIVDTLQPRETGLLFLGLLHSLDGMLPADIGVARLEYTTPVPPDSRS